MKHRWEDYDVEIITDLELPKVIDDSHVRFTLLKKEQSDH